MALALHNYLQFNKTFSDKRMSLLYNMFDYLLHYIHQHNHRAYIMYNDVQPPSRAPTGKVYGQLWIYRESCTVRWNNWRQWHHSSMWPGWRGRQVCTQRRRQYNIPINVTQSSTYVIMYRFVLLVSFAPFDQFGVWCLENLWRFQDGAVIVEQHNKVYIWVEV